MREQHPLTLVSDQSIEQPPSSEQREWTFSSEAESEQKAVDTFIAAISTLSFSQYRLIALKLAVAEAVRNALEHGNQFNPELVVRLQVQISPTTLLVRIADQGTSGVISEPPDLETKLAHPETKRGWGLQLISHIADRWQFANEATGHTIELVMNLDETPESEQTQVANESLPE